MEKTKFIKYEDPSRRGEVMYMTIEYFYSHMALPLSDEQKITKFYSLDDVIHQDVFDEESMSDGELLDEVIELIDEGFIVVKKELTDK